MLTFLHTHSTAGACTRSRDSRFLHIITCRCRSECADCINSVPAAAANLASCRIPSAPDTGTSDASHIVSAADGATATAAHATAATSIPHSDAAAGATLAGAPPAPRQPGNTYLQPWIIR